MEPNLFELISKGRNHSNTARHGVFVDGRAACCQRFVCHIFSMCALLFARHVETHFARHVRHHLAHDLQRSRQLWRHSLSPRGQCHEIGRHRQLHKRRHWTGAHFYSHRFGILFGTISHVVVDVQLWFRGQIFVGSCCECHVNRRCLSDNCQSAQVTARRQFA